MTCAEGTGGKFCISQDTLILYPHRFIGENKEESVMYLLQYGNYTFDRACLPLGGDYWGGGNSQIQSLVDEHSFLSRELLSEGEKDDFHTEY